MGNSRDKNKGRRSSLNTSKTKKSLGKWLTGTFQTFLVKIEFADFSGPETFYGLKLSLFAPFLMRNTMT